MLKREGRCEHCCPLLLQPWAASAFARRRSRCSSSFAREEQKDTSDVDILVEFEDPTFDNFMNLAFFLEDLFNRRVELVTPDSISPYIAPYVKKEVVWADKR